MKLSFVNKLSEVLEEYSVYRNYPKELDFQDFVKWLRTVKRVEK